MPRKGPLASKNVNFQFELKLNAAEIVEDFGITIASSKEILRTTVLFVRHGQTDDNRNRIVQGQTNDCALNNTGVRQSELVASWLSNERAVSVVYSSPLQRAMQTATPISRALRLEIKEEPGLAEMSMGRFEGESYIGSNEPYFEKLFAEWAAGEFSRPVQGGESIEMLQRRALDTMERLVEENAGNTIVVVTHGRWLRVYLSTVLPQYSLANMDEVLHENTAVSKLQYDGHDKISVSYLRLSEHLVSHSVTNG